MPIDEELPTAIQDSLLRTLYGKTNIQFLGWSSIELRWKLKHDRFFRFIINFIYWFHAFLIIFLFTLAVVSLL